MSDFVVKDRQTGQTIARGNTHDHSAVKLEGNWYFDPKSVDMSQLRITNRIYHCPYKGDCFWIDLETPEGTTAQNIAWVYNDPKRGYEMIKDKIGFYARDTSGTISIIE